MKPDRIYHLSERFEKLAKDKETELEYDPSDYDENAPTFHHKNRMMIDVQAKELLNMWELPQLKALFPILDREWYGGREVPDKQCRIGSIWIGHDPPPDGVSEDKGGVLKIEIETRVHLSPECIKEYEAAVKKLMDSKKRYDEITEEVEKDVREGPNPLAEMLDEFGKALEKDD
jgi:hypothetical protein